MESQIEDLKEDQKSAKSNMTNIVIGIMGSLLAFMFYGRIEDANDIIKLKSENAQMASELRDVWGKYNDAGEKMMNFMIQDAREKEQIKELIKDSELKAKDVQLENTERWLEFWKEEAHD